MDFFPDESRSERCSSKKLIHWHFEEPREILDKKKWRPSRIHCWIHWNAETSFRLKRLTADETRELCRIGIGLIGVVIYPELVKVDLQRSSTRAQR